MNPVIGNRLEMDFNNLVPIVKDSHPHEYMTEKQIISTFMKRQSPHQAGFKELQLAINHPDLFIRVSSELKYLKRPVLNAVENFANVSDKIDVLRQLADTRWFHKLNINVCLFTSEIVPVLNVFHLTSLHITISCQNFDRFGHFTNFPHLVELHILNDVAECSHVGQECIVRNILASSGLWLKSLKISNAIINFEEVSQMFILENIAMYRVTLDFSTEELQLFINNFKPSIRELKVASDPNAEFIFEIFNQMGDMRDLDQFYFSALT